MTRRNLCKRGERDPAVYFRAERRVLATELITHPLASWRGTGGLKRGSFGFCV